MKYAYGRIFSLCLSGALVFAYFYQLPQIALFASIILWVLILLSALVMPLIALQNSKFDDGTMVEKDKEKLYGDRKTRGWMSKSFNVLMSSIQVTALIINDYPITAAFYFLVNFFAMCVMEALDNRAKQYQESKAPN